MRVLITGGFGFVGGRVARHLQEAGHVVLLGTRHVVEAPAWLPNAQVERMHWQDTAALEHTCQGIDTIVHAAGMNAQESAADPVAALAFNGVATARLVAAAARAKVKQFVYLSTAHVYASPLTGTITEDTCPRNLHPYATSHLAGEHSVLQVAQHDTMKSVVLRLSNTFGAPTHKGANCWMLLVNDLCRQAVVSRRMVLYSSGMQHRDFIAMTDVCQVINWLTSGNSSGCSTVMNVGTGVSQSVIKMARLIQERCQAVFGFVPEIVRPDAMSGEKHEPLYFKSKFLKKQGLSLSQNSITEIDELLNFCDKHFRLDGK